MALGLNYFTRMAMCARPLVQEISEMDGVWTIRTVSTLLSYDIEFRIGEEFDYTWPDGREVRAVVWLENENRLVAVHTAKRRGQKNTWIAREFTEQGMVQTTTISTFRHLPHFSDVGFVTKYKRI